MFIGAIDTSHGFSFALFDQDQNRVVIDHRQPGGLRNDTREMPLTIQRLIRDQELHAAMIPRWIVGTGPGSFTGIRTGISFIAGICLQTAAEHYGLPSSLAVAIRVLDRVPEGGLLGVLNDARQGQFIASVYRKINLELELEQAAAVIDPKAIPPAVADCSILTSVQAEAVEPYLGKELAARLVPQVSVDATAFFAAPIAVPEDQAAREKSLEPVYVRPAVFVSPTVRPLESSGDSG